MKKSGLFKILLVLLFVIGILSWLLNASMFDAQSGSLMSLKDIFTNYYGMEIKTIGIGFFDIFKLIFSTIIYFSDKLIYLLCVGAYYGVLAKTGKYRAWIDKVAEKSKGKEKSILISISLCLIIVSSLTNYGILFLTFIPMLIGIVLALGYDKITAFITTFGAVILGELGSTFGYSISYVINNTIGTTLKAGIAYKFILLLLAIVFLIIYIIKASHNKTDLKQLDDFVGEKSSNKYSVASLFVVFSILLVILILGCTNWSIFIKNGSSTIFETFHDKIMATKVANVELFKNLSGTYYNLLFSSSPQYSSSIVAFGYWGLEELSIILLLVSLLIGRLYRMKHSEILDSMINGVKKMLVPALLVLFAHVILLASQYYYPVIAEAILNLTSKFNVLTSSITMMIGTVLNVEMSYISANAIPQIVANGGNITLLTLMSQGIYGVISLIAPTSLLLIVGLSYLEIPYTEYLKKMWKFILILLAAIIAFLLILSFIL